MIYGIIGAFVAGLLIAFWDGHTRLEEFKAMVGAVGQLQEERTKSRIELEKAFKKEADDAYKAQHDRDAADIARLRKRGPSRSELPTAPANSDSPSLACFDRAELAAAFRVRGEGIDRYRGTVLELVAEGGEATAALDSAKGWALKLANELNLERKP